MKRHHVRAALLGLIILLGTTACMPNIDWARSDKAGPIIEVGAARASIGIWRAPRSVLYSVYRAKGIRTTADVIWAVGRPPMVKLSVAGRTLAVDVLSSKMKGWIYGDLDDLRGALREAQANQDCLALTVISHGKYEKNWTHKSVGCRIGKI